MEFREFLKNRYVHLDIAEREHVLRFTRTENATRFDDDADKLFQEVSDALSRFDPKRWAMLIDVRLAPSNNDPEFESYIAKWQMALFRRFDRTVVLVRTAAGRLQIKRMSERSGRTAAIFLDESEALAHLRDSTASNAKPRAPA
jgi:hypothetical protein